MASGLSRSFLPLSKKQNKNKTKPSLDSESQEYASEDWKDSIAGRIFALHVVELGSIPCTPYGPLRGLSDSTVVRVLCLSDVMWLLACLAYMSHKFNSQHSKIKQGGWRDDTKDWVPALQSKHLIVTLAPEKKKRDKGARVTVELVRLHMVKPNWVLFLTPCMTPQTPSSPIPEHRTSGKSWASPTVAPNRNKV